MTISQEKALEVAFLGWAAAVFSPFPTAFSHIANVIGEAASTRPEPLMRNLLDSYLITLLQGLVIVESILPPDSPDKFLSIPFFPHAVVWALTLGLASNVSTIMGYRAEIRP